MTSSWQQKSVASPHSNSYLAAGFGIHPVNMATCPLAKIDNPPANEAMHCRPVSIILAAALRGLCGLTRWLAVGQAVRAKMV
jgi:hypothetical protein